MAIGITQPPESIHCRSETELAVSKALKRRFNWWACSKPVTGRREFGAVDYDRAYRPALTEGRLDMPALTLEQASIIVDKALEKGRELKLQPLTVVVLDAGGQMRAMKREDRSSLMRPEIAGGKAWGVLGMGFGGREFARRAAANPVFLQALMAASGGRIVPVPGGVLIRDASSDIIGSVGISGDTSDRDEICAVHGIKSAGLTPDTGDPS